MKKIDVKEISFPEAERRDDGAKEKRAGSFRRFFVPAALAAALAVSPVLIGCGEDKADVRGTRGNDAGQQQDGDLEDDAATTDTEKEDTQDTDTEHADACEFARYAVLNIDGERKVVEYGSTVTLNGVDYILREADSSPVLEGPDGALYILDAEKEIGGSKVDCLGSGTREVDTSLIQVEIYRGEASAHNLLLKNGEVGMLDLGGQYHVKITVNDVVKAGTVEYTSATVDVFAESSSGGDTLIVSKSVSLEADVNGIADIVVDDATSFNIGIDLLGNGTSNAKAMLSVNGSTLSMEASGEQEFESAKIGVASIFHSEQYPTATVKIDVGSNILLRTLMKDEVVRIDVGDGEMLRVELEGTESLCSE